MLIRQRFFETPSRASPTSDAPPSWFPTLWTQLSERFSQQAGTSDGFPCVFAQNAFKRRNIVVAVVPLKEGANPGAGHDLDSLARDLGEYLDDDEWDGSPNTSEPLLAVFEPDPRVHSEAGYRALFDTSMQHLIDHDTHP